MSDTELMERVEIVNPLGKNVAVIMINDDKTSFDFVITILQKYFGFTTQNAELMATNVHTKGKDVIAVLPEQTAQMKVNMVHQEASRAGYPFTLKIQPF